MRHSTGRILLALALFLPACQGVVKPNKNTEWAPDVRLAQVATPPVAGRKPAVASPDGVRRAYLRDTPDAADRDPQHVYLEAGNRTWVILGIPFEGHPLANPRWQDAGTLVFERWYDEHAGIRLYIDAYKGVLGRAEAAKK